jgi:6,7-dimethyl-8-ribityllumazine synthase
MSPAVRVIEGDLVARDLRFAILAARFNSLVVDRLIEGAIDALVRHGAADKNIELVRVPGAFEMPVVASRLARSGRYQGVIALGAVIEGDTAHFEFVAGQCAAGLARVAHDHGLPVGFGVLTTATMEQALDRAGGKAGNKGAEAALAVLETVNVIKRLDA